MLTLPVTNEYSNAPKPSDMAPFIPGDFVTFAGIKNGASEILCYSIVAENVQILTSSANGDPVYLRVEDVSLNPALSTKQVLMLILSGSHWRVRWLCKC